MAKAANRLTNAAKGKFNPEESLKAAMIDNKQVLWSDIKDGISGYVRLIRYTNHSLPNEIDLNKADTASKLINLRPDNLEIETVEEGSFKQGLKDGYCRVM